MVIIDVGRFGAFVLDLDGVITRTASIHARAWKQLFDQFLAQRAAQSATPFLPYGQKIKSARKPGSYLLPV